MMTGRKKSPIRSEIYLVIQQNGETLNGARRVAVKFNRRVGPYGQSSVDLDELKAAAVSLCENDVDVRTKKEFEVIS